MKAADGNTTEMIQAKCDLGRTQHAERVHRLRRAQKNTVLQTGGVLTVVDERILVRKKEESEVAKAERILEAALQKARRAAQRGAKLAAKKARAWRTSRILRKAAVYEDSQPMKLLVRF